MRPVLFLAGVMALIVVGSLPASALAAPGDLDLTFGTDGIAYTDVPLTPDAVAVQSDGKIVAVWGTLVERFTASGALDTSFGVAGSATLPGGTEGFARLMIQPVTDRILVQQTTDRETRYGADNAIYHNRIVALTNDGVLDPSFANSGVLTTPNDTLYVPLCYEMASDGSLMGGGYAYTDNGDLAVYRFTPDGAPDTSFGTSGVVTEALAPGTFDIVCGLAILHDGRILLAGAIQVEDGFFLRLLPDGSHDPSFHGGQIYIRPDAMYSPVEGSRFIELVNGDLVIPRGTSLYRLPANCVESSAYANPIFLPGGGNWAITSDGGLVAAGIVNNGYPSYNDFVVKRFTPYLLPDETFAPKGTVVKDFGSPEDAVSTAVFPDGRVLVAGVATGLTATLTRADALPRVDPLQGLLFQLQGGTRTNLSTKLTRSGASTVTLALKSGTAKWTTTAKLTCNGTPVGGAKVKLMRSRDRRRWTQVGSAMTNRSGKASVIVRFTRRGTYYVRWLFAGTTSYRRAVSPITKVVVR